MKTCFVIDTNVLMRFPEVIAELKTDVLVLPGVVLTEIDNHKTDKSEIGKNCRTVNRILDGYRQLGSLEAGVARPDGTIIKVVYSDKALNKAHFPEMKFDDYIISTAVLLSKDHNVVVLSNDLNVRVRSNSLGLRAEGFQEEARNQDKSDDNMVELSVDIEDINGFYQEGFLDLNISEFDHNQYLILKELDGTASALAKVNKDKSRLEPVKKIPAGGIFGVKARGKEQTVAFDALMDQNIQLVVLTGKAGCGKDFIGLSSSLHQVIEEKKYDKVSVAKTLTHFHSEIGFLPGLLAEKLQPFMQSIYDTLEELLGISKKSKNNKNRSYEELIDLGFLQVEALPFIRGKSLNNQILLVSEAQNLTPLEIKTIVTRMGANGKLIFTADFQQIDNHKLDAESNGIKYLINRFKGQKMFAHINLVKSERSPLAELAAELL